MTADDEPIDVRALTRRLRANPYRGAITNVSLRAKLGTTPADAYETLLQRLQIRPHPGTAATLVDGAVDGYVMELLDGRHVVLSVRLIDGRWPEGHYSTLTFMLRPELDDTTTFVVFEQDVPVELSASVADMWNADYVEPLSAMFPVS